MHPATVSWIHISLDDDIIPANAVEVSRKLYFGRARHNNITVAGIIDRLDRVFYYIYDDQVHSQIMCEILLRVPYE